MGAGGEVIEALRALHAAAVDPPAANADADDVIEAGAAMMANRAQPFERLRRALENDPDRLVGNEESRRLVESLKEKDRRWGAALERARSVVGDRAAAVRKMRQTRGGGYGKR